MIAKRISWGTHDGVSIFEEERKQFEDDPNLVEHVDYAVAFVDHDHSYDAEGELYSGNPDSVRGLLCPSCNAKDVLNPVSDFYIYGDDPMVRETLIKNREMNIILKEWRKEENSKKWRNNRGKNIINNTI